jgi:hypothetical protein
MQGLSPIFRVGMKPAHSGSAEVMGEAPFPLDALLCITAPSLNYLPQAGCRVAGLLPTPGPGRESARNMAVTTRMAGAVAPLNRPVVRRLALQTIAPSFTDDRPFTDQLPMSWLKPAKRFWGGFPANWRVLALSTPIALTLVMYSVVSYPPAVAANSSSEKGRETGAFTEIRKKITERAAINLTDDFRTGLYAWEGRGDWGASWSYDSAGFVHPGQLALYSPSAGLTDYSLEFVGQIRKRGMGWAFRAANLDNYYAVKLVVTRPGPMPVLALVRYTVVRGKEYGRTQVPVRLEALNDTLYRIRLDVQGTRFSVWVNGKLADTWEDTRLKAGGIGFFSDRGEESMLRWMAISHQSDLVGKLCAALAG